MVVWTDIDKPMVEEEECKSTQRMNIIDQIPYESDQFLHTVIEFETPRRDPLELSFGDLQNFSRTEPKKQVKEKFWLFTNENGDIERGSKIGLKPEKRKQMRIVKYKKYH